MMSYSFVSDSKKEYTFFFDKDVDPYQGLPKETLYVVSIQDTPKTGFYFPIIKKDEENQVAWFEFEFTATKLPMDLKKRIDKIVKLMCFS